MVAPRAPRKQPFVPVDFSQQGEISNYEPTLPSDQLRRLAISLFSNSDDQITNQTHANIGESLLQTSRLPALADTAYYASKALLDPSYQNAATAGVSLLGAASPPAPGKAQWAPRIVKEIQERFHPSNNYLRRLEAEVPTLYRETSGASFLDMLSGNHPFGAPREHYAETQELALGQGNNKGLTFKVNTKGLEGKTNLSKPMSQEMYRQRNAEFLVSAQPSQIIKNIEEITVTKDAFSNLSKGQAQRLKNTLDSMEKAGIKVNRQY